MKCPALLSLLLCGGSLAGQDAAPARAVDFGRPFGDHMVLQRDRPIPVFGQAPGRAAVVVRFGDQQRSTTAGDDGRWSVEFGPRAADATGRALVVTAGGVSRRIADVLVGDVWLCAGQSNMRFPLRSAAGGAAAIAAARDPAIRYLDFQGRLYPSRREYPLELLRSLRADNYYTTTGWQRCDPARIGGFSAVAYYFAVALRQRLGVPVGLIHNAVGGVPVESYIPRTALAADPELRRLLVDWFANPEYPAWCRQRGAFNLRAWRAGGTGPPPHHPFEPGFLFEAGIRPLLPMAIRGVLWYQGESNATVDGGGGRPVDLATNERKLTTLIRSWRAAWRRPTLPFLYVQLPGLNREWAPFREVQRRVARQLPHVHYAVSLDCGDPTDVHPRRKRPVGERLARIAAGLAGHQEVARGPEFAGMERRGRRLVLRFDHAGGLRTVAGGPPRCFAVAGDDRAFQPATAVIAGATVVVSCAAVPAPVAVRYAWRNDPPVNLVNGAGLPAAPFRTDDWPLVPKIRVACIGDSITAGLGIADPARASYPARLGALLGPDFDVREFGSPGRGILKRSLRGSGKRAFLFQPEHAAALAHAPDIVVCNLGINDIMDWERAGRLEFIRDYRELLQAYKGLPSRPRLVVWSPLAPLFPGHRFAGDRRIPAIEAAITTAARLEGAEVVDMAAPLRGAGAEFPDHIHPNAAGAARIAAHLAATIRWR